MKQDTTKLQDFIFTSKYARTIAGKKETWEQSVDRVMKMHWQFITKRYELDKEKQLQLQPYFEEAYDGYQQKYAIGAQRALQWGGDQLLKHHMKAYNCTSSYANRVDFFHELMYILLCGAGAGYSVQKHHVSKLPKVKGVESGVKRKFTIPDSIEGWAESFKELTYAHFYGTVDVEFNYSFIRPKGAPISGGFKAPGHEPLEKALEKTRDILRNAKGRKLRPFEVHRISCIIADAVVSGGVRRSALIVLFSADDEEMLNCKTGDWFYKYPELARANNSIVILPTTPKELYSQVFDKVKQFGEPGIAFLKNKEFTYNPCFEVGMFPTLEIEDESDQYGWSTCNLSEVNGNKADTEENFRKAVRTAAILGTFQACYTDYPYLGNATEQIIRRDALIGVGITGMSENPHTLFDPILQRKMAEEVKRVNQEVSTIIGINAAARTTVVKPSGNSSQMLGTSSGIHPFHALRYIRNVQVNKEEFAGQVYRDVNPEAVQDSVWNSENDYVISFPIEVAPGALTKSNISALDFMGLVGRTQQNWIECGTNFDHPSYKRNPELRHNVSNTISVNPDEWETVEEYLWENRENFCGISMLGGSGDIDYPQAPYTEVFNELQLAKMYGSAAILGSGLIVDGIHAFGDLWVAISTALGQGEKLEVTSQHIAKIIESGINPDLEFKYLLNGVMLTDVNAVIAHVKEIAQTKQDWVRRFKKFARTYLGNNLEITGRCLKHVSVFHQWEKIKNSKTVVWEDVEWAEELTEAGSETASGCYGGACEI